MAEFFEELKAMMLQQTKMMEMLTLKLSTDATARPGPTSVSQSVDNTANSITDFMYDPQANVTFESWFKRYEDLFTIDLAAQDDAWKVRLLLRKLGPAEHERYSNYILPKNTRDVPFAETVQTLKQIFGEPSSLLNMRYQCLQLTKRESDDFITYAGIVNRECGRFQLGSLTEDQFKCLIFICGLQSPKDADVRTRLLTKVQQDPKATPQTLAEECQNLLNLKHDAAMIQHADWGSSSIHAVASTKLRCSPPAHPPAQVSKKTPPSPCRHCGDWHYHRDCLFRQNCCQLCSQVGHKDGFCQSRSIDGAEPASTIQSRSGSRRQPLFVGRSLSLHAPVNINTTGQRRSVSIHVNGQPVRLQLDTASDVTIISEKLWRSLGQPSIEQAAHFVTSACGGPVRLTGKLHCCISFRGTTVSSSCYVSSADINLLGLDWLEQLGLTNLSIRTICDPVLSPAVLHGPVDDITQRSAPEIPDGLGLCSSNQAVPVSFPGSQLVLPERPVAPAAVELVDAELQISGSPTSAIGSPVMAANLDHTTVTQRCPTTFHDDSIRLYPEKRSYLLPPPVELSPAESLDGPHRCRRPPRRSLDEFL